MIAGPGDVLDLAFHGCNGTSDQRGNPGIDTALGVMCKTGERLLLINTESVWSALPDEYVPIKCHVDGTLEKYKEPHVLCMEVTVASHRTRREFSDGHGGPGYGHGTTEGSAFVLDAQLKVNARGFQRAVTRKSAPCEDYPDQAAPGRFSGVGNLRAWLTNKEWRLFDRCKRNDQPLLPVELHIGVGGAKCKGFIPTHPVVPFHSVRALSGKVGVEFTHERIPSFRVVGPGSHQRRQLGEDRLGACTAEGERGDDDSGAAALHS